MHVISYKWCMFLKLFLQFDEFFFKYLTPEWCFILWYLSIINLVTMWFYGSKIWCLVVSGQSVFSNLPPHRSILCLSRYRPSCFIMFVGFKFQLYDLNYSGYEVDCINFIIYCSTPPIFLRNITYEVCSLNVQTISQKYNM